MFLFQWIVFLVFHVDTTVADACRVLFVTSEAYNGNLGGIGGANQICNILAQDAEPSSAHVRALANAGGFEAYIGINGMRPRQVVSSPSTGCTMLPSGITLHVGPLDDSKQPIPEDENGGNRGFVAGYVWTGLRSRDQPGLTCDDWSTAEHGLAGAVGNNVVGPLWLGLHELTCSSPRPIYCLSTQAVDCAPRACSLSSWRQWSECECKSPDVPGNRARSRSVIVAPLCGPTCEPVSEVGSCNCPTCSEWSMWSQCNCAANLRATRTRSRTGTACATLQQVDDTCGGEWSEWSECACRDQKQVRTRMGMCAVNHQIRVCSCDITATTTSTVSPLTTERLEQTFPPESTEPRPMSTEPLPLNGSANERATATALLQETSSSLTIEDTFQTFPSTANNNALQIATCKKHVSCEHCRNDASRQCSWCVSEECTHFSTGCSSGDELPLSDGCPANEFWLLVGGIAAGGCCCLLLATLVVALLIRSQRKPHSKEDSAVTSNGSTELSYIPDMEMTSARVDQDTTSSMYSSIPARPLDGNSQYDVGPLNLN